MDELRTQSGCTLPRLTRSVSTGSFASTHTPMDAATRNKETIGPRFETLDRDGLQSRAFAAWVAPLWLGETTHLEDPALLDCRVDRWSTQVPAWSVYRSNEYSMTRIGAAWKPAAGREFSPACGSLVVLSFGHQDPREVPSMTRIFSSAIAVATAVAGILAPIPLASADDVIIGVSWRHFQEERWRIDERGIKEELAAAGEQYKYISADAQSDPQKQLTDLEGLVARGAQVLIVLAQDSNAVMPGIERAKAEGIPIIAYDVPIDDPDVLFLSFDNVAVGRLMAEAMVAVKPEGKWAIIKGDAQMPIVDLFFSGQWQVVEPLVASGAIEIVAEQNVENWKPDVAQNTMDQILTANNNQVDAVLTMNDGMAGGVVAALTAQGMEGIPVSGQDGDVAALNRIAKGHQTVSVWKNSYELGRAAARAAVALAGGADMLSVEGAVPYETPSGATQAALLLEPIKVTRDNLNLVIDANWIDKESLCQGVTENAPAACQ